MSKNRIPGTPFSSNGRHEPPLERWDRYSAMVRQHLEKFRDDSPDYAQRFICLGAELPSGGAVIAVENAAMGKAMLAAFFRTCEEVGLFTQGSGVREPDFIPEPEPEG